MDNIKTQLDRLTELSDEQIEALETQIIAEFETLEASDHTPESVEAMMTLADFVDQVRGETQRREALSEELSTKAVEAAARIRKEEPNVTEEPEEVEDAADEAADEAIEASAETVTTEQAEPIEASAENAETVEAETTEESLASEEAAPEEETVTAAAENDDDKTQAEETVETIDTDADKTEEPAEDQPEASEDEDQSLAAETVEAAAEASDEENTINTTTDEPLAQEEEATVTAAANEGFEAPADRRPKAQEIEAAPVAITAGADIPGYSAGQNLTKDDVSQAFISRLNTLRRVSGGGDGEQYTVASFKTDYSEDRTLGLDALENATKIESAQAIVAAGGYGGVSVAPNYDIFDLGASSARPVRDSLPRFAADRGSVRYIVPPSLADYEEAVGVWTAATDANPGENTKNVLVVEGATERTAELYAVTLQLQIGNFMARALPELVDRHNELALVQHSRIAELELLKQIDSYSTDVTAGKVLGVARDFLVQMRKAAAAYRSRHRIERDRALQAILPEWVVQAIAADLTMQMPGDDTLSVGLNTIEGYLSALNVRVTTTPDIQPFGAQPAGALLDFPSTFDWFLFAEGTFIFLDGGTLDLGIIRDSTLVGTNDYRMFVETFEGLGFPGVESLRVRSTFAVTGEAAALTDTTAAVTP